MARDYGYLFHVVIAASITLKLVEALICLNCNDVADPRLCRHVTTCYGGEKCGMETFISHDGSLQYNLGCVKENTCSVASTPMPSGSGLTLFYSCHDCCDDSDLCNIRGCNITGYPHIRGPICFNCENHPVGYPCHMIEACETHEVCYSTARLDFETSMVYSSGCISKHNCATPQLDPVRVLAVGKRSTHICSDCCDADLCNVDCQIKSNCKDEPTCPLLMASYDICKTVDVAKKFCPRSCNICPQVVAPITTTQVGSSRTPTTAPTQPSAQPTTMALTQPPTTSSTQPTTTSTTQPTTVALTQPPTQRPTTSTTTAPTQPTTQPPTTSTTTAPTQPTTQTPTTSTTTAPTQPPTMTTTTAPTQPTTQTPTTSTTTAPTQPPTTTTTTAPTHPTTQPPTTTTTAVPTQPPATTSTTAPKVCGPALMALIVNGTKVVRGPDWAYGNQDGGSVGIVIGPGLGSGWVKVRWASGSTNEYRNGADNLCELMPVNYLTTPAVGTTGSTVGVRVGDLVVRGPDWIYGDQDKHSFGRIEKLRFPVPGFVKVHWIASNVTNVYRMDGKPGGKHDVILYNGTTVASTTGTTSVVGTTIVLPTYGPQLAHMMYVGARVVRGKDWNWDEQDSHGEGDVIEVPPSSQKGWVRVRWDNGTTNFYRMGANGAYDLMFVPGSYKPPTGK